MDSSAVSYGLLGVHMTISLGGWLQLVFSMNRFRGPCNFFFIDVWALVVYLQAGAVRWVASLAVREPSVAFQLTVACLGTVLSWVAFVLIFNEKFSYPTAQQFAALFMSLILTLLWEASSRLVVLLPPQPL